MSEQAHSSHNKSPEAELADQIYGSMRQIADTAILAGYEVTERVTMEWTDNPERTRHINLGSYDIYPYVEISVAETQGLESSEEEPRVYLHLFHSELPDDDADKYYDEHGEPRFDENNEEEVPKDVDVLCTQYAVPKDDEEDVNYRDQDRVVLKFEEKHHFYFEDCYATSDLTLLNPTDSEYPVSIEELKKLDGILAGLLGKVESGPENKQ